MKRRNEIARFANARLAAAGSRSLRVLDGRAWLQFVRAPRKQCFWRIAALQHKLWWPIMTRV